MGKAVLVFFLGSLITFGIVNLSTNSNLTTGLSASVLYYSEMQTRNIANSAISMLASELADSNSWRVETPETLSMFGGSAIYTVIDTVIGTDSLIKINVNAYYSGSAKYLYACIRPFYESPEIPVIMTYAVTSGVDFSTSGQPQILQDFGYPFNANVRTNGNVNLGTGNGIIKGFIHYAGTAGTAGNLTTVVQPYSNPTNKPKWSKMAAIKIPKYNASDFNGKATLKFSNANEILKGAITLGTQAKPAVWWFAGNLDLSDCTFTGYGTFCVTGSVTISGTNKFSSANPFGSTLGLYINGGLTMSGNSRIDANIFTNSIINTGGNASVYGTLSSLKSISLGGGFILYFRPPVSEISKPFFPDSTLRLSRPVNVAQYYE